MKTRDELKYYSVTYDKLAEIRIVTKIHSFRHLDQGWHFGEGIPITDEYIEAALQLHQAIIDQGCRRTDAFPGLAGQVRVTAYFHGHYLEFTIVERDKVDFLYEKNGEEEREESDLTLSQAMSVLSEVWEEIWNLFALSEKTTTGTTTLGDFKVSLSPTPARGEFPSSIKIASSHLDGTSVTISEPFMQNRSPVPPPFTGNSTENFFLTNAT
jgi:hypothetical protein